MSEEEFLGIMMKCKTEKDTCSIGKIERESGLNCDQCSDYLKSLKRKGLISNVDLETYKINPIAYSIHRRTKHKFSSFIFQNSVLLFKFLATCVFGVISGILIAYFTHKFGW